MWMTESEHLAAILSALTLAGLWFLGIEILGDGTVAQVVTVPVAISGALCVFLLVRGRPQAFYRGIALAVLGAVLGAIVALVASGGEGRVGSVGAAVGLSLGAGLGFCWGWVWHSRRAAERAAQEKAEAERVTCARANGLSGKWSGTRTLAEPSDQRPADDRLTVDFDKMTATSESSVGEGIVRIGQAGLAAVHWSQGGLETVTINLRANELTATGSIIAYSDRAVIKSSWKLIKE